MQYTDKMNSDSFYIEFDTELFHNVILETPISCPVCKIAHIPKFLKNFFTHDLSGTLISVFFLCPNCKSTYCIDYLLPKEKLGLLRSSTAFSYSILKNISPYKPQTNDFVYKDVVNISKRANEIYIQTQKAEQLSLTELFGMGYRKCLEILVKDYLISLKIEQKEKIQKMNLSDAIDKLEDDNLKLLASRCTWLGNDESHYLKKHTEYDTNTIKELLEGVITYIHLKLLVEKSKEISPK